MLFSEIMALDWSCGGEALKYIYCVCAFGVSRFGTERLYAQKEDLLHEVLELEAEKGLLASGESTKYQVGVRGVMLTVSVLLTPNVAIELRSCRWLNTFHKLLILVMV